LSRHVNSGLYGTFVAAAIFGGILTGISMLFNKLVRKPLNKAQIISTFAVTSLLFVAMIIYHRCTM
jgi:hypothetical protein